MNEGWKEVGAESGKGGHAESCESIASGPGAPFERSSPTSCVILIQLLHFSEPQFPDLHNGGDNGTSLLVLG